jgi:hypothetical protein
VAGKIFISYRRDDEPHFTGRLFDQLQTVFSREQLFMDVDSIAPGVDFVKMLEEQVAQCDVLLAVIGRGWLTATDELGGRRVDNPADFCRMEIEAALAHGKRVTPVLVGDARMPRPEELPDGLKPLARRQAMRLTHENFGPEAAVLVHKLAQVLREAKPVQEVERSDARNARARAAKADLPSPAESGKKAPPRARNRIVAAGIGAMLLLVALVGALVVRQCRGVTTPDMVTVAGGPFFMGCNEKVDSSCQTDERPGQLVIVAPFAIDRTEVTVAQYRACVEAGRCDEPDSSDPSCNWGKPDRDSHPVNCVDWYQATAYCDWAGKRLPTEAEWEKAARGTDRRVYPWGNAWETDRANVASDGTKPVGSYPSGASPYSALDMAGNVWEWVSDNVGGGRGLRGGSWYGRPSHARASYRLSSGPGDRRVDVGFRCAQ